MINTQAELDVMPYLPKGRTIQFVPSKHKYILLAKETAIASTSDHTHPTGAVIVKNEEVIGKGANYSAYHAEHGCERKKLGCPTGEGYELCEGCNPKYHAEPSAIRNALENLSVGTGFKPFPQPLKDSSLFLWGHWWCCKDCWAAMIEAGIENVYLMEGAREEFLIKKR